MRVTSAVLGFLTAAVVVALALAVPASAGPLGASTPLDVTVRKLRAPPEESCESWCDTKPSSYREANLREHDRRNQAR